MTLADGVCSASQIMSGETYTGPIDCSLRSLGLLFSGNDLISCSGMLETPAYIRQRVEPLTESLSLVFHRYLHGRQGGIQIRSNGKPVLPLDPFVTTNPATQSSPTQHFSVGGSEVSVTAYTLPHVSKLTPDERQRRDLGERMREAQGLYVYRNRRLISHGHWYGLSRMDELSNETRSQSTCRTH